MEFQLNTRLGQIRLRNPDFKAFMHSDRNRTSAVAVMLGILVGVVVAQAGAPQRNPPDYRGFLPPPAVVVQELSLDFENDGVGEIVLVFTIPDDKYDVYHSTGVQVLKYSSVSGWAVAFEETESKMTYGDRITLEKLRSPAGNEGAVVISYHSGAGTVTSWHVLASVRTKISRLDPARLRIKVLNGRGYKDNGYNGVRSKGDLVIEDLPGYSRHAPRCCSDRPSIEMIFKFTGSSIALNSVKELPASPTKH